MALGSHADLKPYPCYDIQYLGLLGLIDLLRLQVILHNGCHKS